MQVKLHGSLCITAVFLYCYGHREKKRNLSQRPRKYAILALRSKKFFWGGGTPSPHSTPLAPSAPWLGSRLRRSTLAPPTSTPGSAYEITLKTTIKYNRASNVFKNKRVEAIIKTTNLVNCHVIFILLLSIIVFICNKSQQKINFNQDAACITHKIKQISVKYNMKQSDKMLCGLLTNK